MFLFGNINKGLEECRSVPGVTHKLHGPGGYGGSHIYLYIF